MIAFEMTDRFDDGLQVLSRRARQKQSRGLPRRRRAGPGDDFHFYFGFGLDGRLQERTLYRRRRPLVLYGHVHGAAGSRTRVGFGDRVMFDDRRQVHRNEVNVVGAVYSIVDRVVQRHRHHVPQIVVLLDDLGASVLQSDLMRDISDAVGLIQLRADHLYLFF